jgi:hypothetical protein
VSGTSHEGREGWMPIPANISMVPPISPTASRFTGQLFDAPELVVYPLLLIIMINITTCISQSLFICLDHLCLTAYHELFALFL